MRNTKFYYNQQQNENKGVFVKHNHFDTMRIRIDYKYIFTTN